MRFAQISRDFDAEIGVLLGQAGRDFCILEVNFHICMIYVCVKYSTNNAMSAYHGARCSCSATIIMVLFTTTTAIHKQKIEESSTEGKTLLLKLYSDLVRNSLSTVLHVPEGGIDP